MSFRNNSLLSRKKFAVCCGNSFYDGWVTPVQESSFEGGQIQFIAMQQDANCYGQVYPAYQEGLPFYSSSDTSICNPGFTTGTTTGVGPGEALINAGWTADAWFFGPFGVCDYTPEEVLRDAICQIVDCLFTTVPILRMCCTLQRKSEGVDRGVWHPASSEKI